MAENNPTFGAIGKRQGVYDISDGIWVSWGSAISGIGKSADNCIGKVGGGGEQLIEGPIKGILFYIK